MFTPYSLDAAMNTAMFFVMAAGLACVGKMAWNAMWLPGDQE